MKTAELKYIEWFKWEDFYFQGFPIGTYCYLNDKFVMNISNRSQEGQYDHAERMENSILRAGFKPVLRVERIRVPKTGMPKPVGPKAAMRTVKRILNEAK